MTIHIESKVFSKTSSVVGHPSIDVFVADGYTMVGGGACVHYNDPGNLLYQCHPIQAPSGAWSGWRANSKDCWLASPAKITTYAVGIKITKDGEPVTIEQNVVRELSEEAVFPQDEDHEGWVGICGGTKCSQNIYENVLLSESSPIVSQENEADPNIITGWRGAKQYAPSPTSNGGPTGGGGITNYFMEIRSAEVQLKTEIRYRDSEVSQQPSVDVPSEGGLIVAGGAKINKNQSCWTNTGENEKSMLTATYPVVDEDGRIIAWRAGAKDHNVPSPVSIRAFAVILTAE